MAPKAIGVGVPPSDIIELAVSGRGGRLGGIIGDIGGESIPPPPSGDGAGE